MCVCARVVGGAGRAQDFEVMHHAHLQDQLQSSFMGGVTAPPAAQQEQQEGGDDEYDPEDPFAD